MFVNKTQQYCFLNQSSTIYLGNFSKEVVVASKQQNRQLDEGGGLQKRNKPFVTKLPSKSKLLVSQTLT